MVQSANAPRYGYRKKACARAFIRVKQSIYLIDTKRNFRRVWLDVKVKDNLDAVLEKGKPL